MTHFIMLLNERIFYKKKIHITFPNRKEIFFYIRSTVIVYILLIELLWIYQSAFYFIVFCNTVEYRSTSITLKFLNDSRKHIFKLYSYKTYEIQIYAHSTISSGTFIIPYLKMVQGKIYIQFFRRRQSREEVNSPLALLIPTGSREKGISQECLQTIYFTFETPKKRNKNLTSCTSPSGKIIF